MENKKRNRVSKEKLNGMKPFIEKCFNSGLTSTDISNLTYVPLDKLGAVHGTMKKLGINNVVGFNKIIKWAKEVDCYTRISQEAAERHIKLAQKEKEIQELRKFEEEQEKKEKSKNIKELFELAASMNITLDDMIKAKKNEQ